MQLTGGAGLPRFDVAVVGAGPAGSSAAFHLLQASPELKVALIERLDDTKLPRYHRMCGEGISQAGLRETGLNTATVIEQRITTVVEHWPGGLIIPTKVHGAIIDRTKLLLLFREEFQRQGGHFVDGSVLGMVRGANGFELRLANGKDFEATYLIGADGAHSRVRGQFFPDMEPEMIWADQYILDTPTEKDVMHFHYDQRYGAGYRWVFPAREGSKVGFPRGTDPVPPNFLERHRRAIPLARANHLVSGRCCLIGDAAAQVNAISFGGIRIAMMAGRMAAEAVVRDDLVRYERRWCSSPFAKASDMDAFSRLRSMSNEEIRGMMEPFIGGYGALGAMKALKHSRNRGLYRAFRASGRYGW